MNSELIKYIKKDKVYAIIPARSGSKGVKNKNIRCLEGFPMLAYSIVACKLCAGIDRIIVSTDSEEYAELARKYGAETPFLRPTEISGDKSTDIEFVQHAINWFAENEGELPELFMHIRPTYPLRDPKVMEDALNRMKNDLSATSLRSAYLATNTPYKWFNLREDGYYKPIRDDMTLDQANSPRQAFPDVYIPDGYVDMLRISHIIEKDLLHGDRMIGFVVPDGIDVDALKDMEYLEFIIKDSGSPIYEELKKNYNTLVEPN